MADQPAVHVFAISELTRRACWAPAIKVAARPRPPQPVLHGARTVPELGLLRSSGCSSRGPSRSPAPANQPPHRAERTAAAPASEEETLLKPPQETSPEERTDSASGSDNGTAGLTPTAPSAEALHDPGLGLDRKHRWLPGPRGGSDRPVARSLRAKVPAPDSFQGRGNPVHPAGPVLCVRPVCLRPRRTPLSFQMTSTLCPELARLMKGGTGPAPHQLSAVPAPALQTPRQCRRMSDP